MLKSVKVFEIGHSCFYGRLKSRLELERDVVDGLLSKQFETDVRLKAAVSIVMKASYVGADVVLPMWRRGRQQRQETEMIEHGQTGAWIDQRLGRHLPNQHETVTMYFHLLCFHHIISFIISLFQQQNSTNTVTNVNTNEVETGMTRLITLTVTLMY